MVAAASETQIPFGKDNQGGSTAAVARQRGRVWLWLAVGLFLCQVLPFLSCRWVTDESWYAGPAYSLAQGHGLRDPAIGPNDLENHLDARPPGTALVISGFFRTLGAWAPVGPAVARLGSVCAGLVLVFAVWRLTRSWLGLAGATVATLVVATDNLVVLASRTARPEALTVMAVLLALLALERYVSTSRRAWMALAGLLMAGATMFHVTVLGYLIGIGLIAAGCDVRARRRDWGLRSVSTYSLGYAVGLLPYAAWILMAPLGRAGFHQEFLSRATDSSLLTRVLAEGRRYNDVLGLGVLHGHGLEHVPVRIFIPLCFVAATAVLWRWRRGWFWAEMALLVPSMLWLVFTVNKSSRYVALLAPVFALTIGAAVAALREVLPHSSRWSREEWGTRDGGRLEETQIPFGNDNQKDSVSGAYGVTGAHRWYRAAVGCVGLVIALQLGANVVLLRAAGKARYTRVGAGLRALIPPDQTAYGSITFWLALHRQPFVSYERTTPEMAAEQDGARYFILGDRVMVNGLPGEEAFVETLKQQLAAVVVRSVVVGRVSDPYYGELVVYRLGR